MASCSAPLSMEVNEENLFIDGLADEERQTVEKFARRLLKLSQNGCNNRVDHGDIDEEDALRLQNVVQAFHAYKKPHETVEFDVVDAGVLTTEYHRRSSAFEHFTNPCRFLVELSEETKVVINNLDDMIQQWRKGAPRKEESLVSMEPPKTDEEIKEEGLWKRRGEVGCIGLAMAFFAPIFYFMDIATDLNLATSHFSTGDPWWGTLTLMLVLCPSIIINLMSYFFYMDDEDKVQRKPESGWRTVKITHILQLGLIERYWRSICKGFMIKLKKPTNIIPYKLNIAMNLDTAMLQMILAFTEDAPQLVLQLYILIRRKLVEKLLSTSLQDMWTLASICLSFISYSNALVGYISSLRDSKRHKGQLRWYGKIAMLSWRAFMTVSRILVLVFFATEFHLWFFLVLILHFIVVLLMIRRHEVDFFSDRDTNSNGDGDDVDNDENVLQHFTRVVIAYMHTFSFFWLEARKTRRWAVKFYSLIALEAVILSVLWFTNTTRYVSLKFEIAGMSLIFLSFAMGLLSLVVYYKFLHPKFKRPQCKWYTNAIPKEELCEDVLNKDEDEDKEQQGEIFDRGVHYPKNRASSLIKYGKKS